MQLALTAGYSLLVVAALHAPTSGVAGLMTRWSAVIHPAMAPIFDFIGQPSCGGAKVDLHTKRLFEAYIQLVAVDLTVACACFLAWSPFWRSWATQLRQAPRWAAAQPERVESEFEIGQGLMLLGAIGAGWFLLVGDDLFGAAGCSRLSPWLFLRAPLLTASLYGFSCFAAAFGTARAR